MTAAPVGRTLPPVAPIVDILAVAAVSGAGFVAESQLRRVGWLDLGEASRGAVAVGAGALAAVAITFARHGSWGDIGLRRPNRLGTIPLWAIGICAAFVIVQAVAVGLVSLAFNVPHPDLSRYDS